MRGIQKALLSVMGEDYIVFPVNARNVALSYLM